ncbi:hypothetical protein CXF96_16715 [Stenotrophomonas sp. Betaine-02u-21]|uniref:hypothetical protein n=1 Tax=unclassified Stenotrophomonas TaxID=196198 RepID=UPI000C32CBBB|nr:MULTISPECIES: hypothetical protein [unclassified Stenotrophomonas]PKH71828.1 hypothetical protein CXF96_16715 [Stenotrophomonas sp. Betaine-02u-21]PKH74930.1 hypothetical protein CXF90_03895 [Stenotrophomonas sp. Betaine-02u-23]PKH95878.1 hypothetical protein CXG43_11680 [Stenotrophomonas sp. Bg11-02]
MNTVAIQHKHTARVLLHEARVRRGAPFSDVLLRWAGNARQRAAAVITQALEEDRQTRTPAQQDLFA